MEKKIFIMAINLRSNYFSAVYLSRRGRQIKITIITKAIMPIITIITTMFLMMMVE